MEARRESDGVFIKFVYIILRREQELADAQRLRLAITDTLVIRR